MSDQYSRAILKMVIAQICQIIGWHSINSNPLEFLVDLMQEYLLRLAKVTHQYSEILGRTEANLDDLGLTFQHMHVLIPELSEYVRNVDSVPCIIPIPRFPVSRDDRLNFLKPGSHEVVTRPVHVHEHLPAMFPDNEHHQNLTEKEETPMDCSIDTVDDAPVPASSSSGSLTQNEASPPSVFKRPSGLLPSEHGVLSKRSKIIEEGRPLREIHSVIMTTSGFLSPAREGKLPEPRTPHQTRPDSPPASSYPMVPPELKITDKKPKKFIKKTLNERKLDKENKKKNQVKELFIPDNITEIKGKKIGRVKENSCKTKTTKSNLSKNHSTSSSSSTKIDAEQMSTDKETTPKTSKIPQTKIKTEKIPEVVPPAVVTQQKEETVDKLISEPDKQKLNIFKKISKPREEKIVATSATVSTVVETPKTIKHKEIDLRENSVGILNNINDEHDEIIDGCVKKEYKKTPRTPEVNLNDVREPIVIKSPTPDVYLFDDMSPPGTPSTPKTPEFSVPVPVVETKKKKIDRNVRKKERRSRSPTRVISPKKARTIIDVDEPPVPVRLKSIPPLEQPQIEKKPNNIAAIPPPFPFPFGTFPSAPGLIPHPIGHPMFTRYPLPMGRSVPGAHPGMPNLPIPPRFLMPNVKPDDFSPPKIHPPDSGKSLKHVVPEIIEIDRPPDKPLKPAVGKTIKSATLENAKSSKNIVSTATIETRNDPIAIVPTSMNISATPVVPNLLPRDDKPEKNDKNNKKSKEHKKEKKDKSKKKKEKKEKYKTKDKMKGKKEKLPKIKDKKEKKDKRKEKVKPDVSTEAVPKITLKLGPASPRPPTPDNTTMKKITIKPLTKKPDEEKKREPSPELAKISALVTRPPKQKVTKVKAEAISHPSDGTDEKKIGDDVPASESGNADQGGRQVWICPACGNQDDGSPMIGCDDCDAWYHWVCVGVQVPPADHEDWYCRLCIAKKQELHDKKKKKRKKKGKQGHGTAHHGS